MFGVKIPTPMVYEVLENRHGVDAPVIDLNLNKNKLSVVACTGLINGSNDTFLFNPKPTVVVIDGYTRREDHGWVWNNQGFATVTTPPSYDIFGLK